MPNLIWFRSDLRLRDNPALHHAVAGSGDGVIALFVLTPGQWSRHDWGGAKVDFLLRNLRALSGDLEKIGIPLLVERAGTFEEVPARLVKMAARHRCGALFFNREYEVNERRRDDRVREACREAGVACRAFHDQTVAAPGDLRTGSGSFYSVYGPFRRRFVEHLSERTPLALLPRPRRRNAPPARPGDLPGSIEGFRRDESIASLWPAGEGEAWRRLRGFLRHRAAAYSDRRDIPESDATSRLSPYFSLGVLSPREALLDAVEANGGRIAAGNRGIAIWIDQLIWREFYRHVLAGFPRVSKSRSFRAGGERVPWRQDEAALDAWKEGRTGYPIVDAGMRELRETGWMHNRLRMLTAMFLTKHLLIDWREGERHFMRHLVDGDLANNNGGWQWSASTGTDAAPYFRVFNPWTQGRRFDPEGAYIHRFLPETKDLPAATLHDEKRMKMRPPLPGDYPLPLVEHRGARERAILAFKGALGKGDVAG